MLTAYFADFEVQAVTAAPLRPPAAAPPTPETVSP